MKLISILDFFFCLVQDFSPGCILRWWKMLFFQRFSKGDDILWAFISFSNVCAWFIFFFQFKWKLASKSEAMKREASRLWKFALRMKHLAAGRSVWFSPACSLVNFIFPCAQCAHCAQCAQCALPIFRCEYLCPSYFVLTMYQVHIIICKYINWYYNLSTFGIIDLF